MYSVEEEWMVIASLFRFFILERRGDFQGPEELRGLCTRHHVLHCIPFNL